MAVRPIYRIHSALMLLAATSCSTPPIPLPDDRIARLDLIEALLDNGDATTAEDLFGYLDETVYLDEDRARFDALHVRALYGTGEYYDAFRVARGFIKEHRFSPLAAIVEDVEFRSGKTLLVDHDDADGAVILSHFVARFEASENAPEALKLLGDYAYDGTNYLVADRRYTQLLQTHPTSEWAAYARYKLALTTFKQVRGPQYDFDQMLLARNELEAYVALAPERPEFLRETQNALEVLERWIAERHVIVADFYRTIDNRAGERLHLERAWQEFPHTPAGQDAGSRLETLREIAPEEAPEAPPP